MEVIRTIESLHSYASNRKLKVLLDTNILIKGCEGKSAEKRLVQQLLAVMEVCTTETVYWEFLRNTNIEKFRKRRNEIAKWKEGGLLHDDAILEENDAVKEMHARLFVLLLKLNANQPRRVLRLLGPDLWIAASCIAARHDHVLTENTNDFPDELFAKIGHFSVNEMSLCLLAFKRNWARKTWTDLFSNPEFTINCNAFFERKT